MILLDYFLVVRGSCYSGYKKCEHHCIEVAVGRGVCKCRERFRLSSDGKSCKGKLLSLLLGTITTSYSTG